MKSLEEHCARVQSRKDWFQIEMLEDWFRGNWPDQWIAGEFTPVIELILAMAEASPEAERVLVEALKARVDSRVLGAASSFLKRGGNGNGKMPA